MMELRAVHRLIASANLFALAALTGCTYGTDYAPGYYGSPTYVVPDGGYGYGYPGYEYGSGYFFGGGNYRPQSARAAWTVRWSARPASRRRPATGTASQRWRCSSSGFPSGTCRPTVGASRSGCSAAAGSVGMWPDALPVGGCLRSIQGGNVSRGRT